MTRNKQYKFGTFVCQCGCRQTFTAQYTTRPPQYVDKQHRNRKLAANVRASRAAKTKELFAKYKARKKAMRAVGIRSGRALDMAMTLTPAEFSYVLKRLELRLETMKGHPDD